MALHRRSFEMVLDAGQRANVVDSGRTTAPNELIVKVHDGQVQAHLNAVGSYQSPPHLRARIVTNGDVASLTGTIKESGGEATWSRGYTFLTGFMVVLAVVGVAVVAAGRASGIAPLIIGIIAAPVFWLLHLRFARIRRPRFERSADALEASVHDYVARRPR